MPHIAGQPRCILVFFTTLIVAIPSKAHAQQDTAVQVSPYRQLAKGVAATTQFSTDSLRGYHTEVMDLILGPQGDAPEVPLGGFALMELRAGRIQLTIDGKQTRRNSGDYWSVSKGARLAIHNLGELAVIHTLVFAPR